MRTRLTRVAILGAFLLSLVPGSAWALCGTEMDQDCCCSGRGCPKPTDTKLQAASCCTAKTPAPSTPATTDKLAQPAGPGSIGRVAVQDPTEAPAVASSHLDVSELSPARVPLYTLHAAFLI